MSKNTTPQTSIIKVRADRLVAGDIISTTKGGATSKVDSIGTIGEKSRWLNLVGRETGQAWRLRPNHSTMLWLHRDEPAGPSQADIDTAVSQLQKELESPEMAAALEATEELVKEEPVKKVKASGSKAQKATSKAPAKGSWASQNPEKVATIPAAIKAGQHPQTFADANGISLAIAWRLFKAEGWVATGKGGGKAFSFSGQAQQDEAHAALQCLADIAEAAGVSISRVIREVEATSR